MKSCPKNSEGQTASSKKLEACSLLTMTSSQYEDLYIFHIELSGHIDTALDRPGNRAKISVESMDFFERFPAAPVLILNDRLHECGG